MANQAGKLVALSVETTTPTVYAVVGGLRAKSVRMNSQTIDVTDSESVDLWQELLSGGGVKSMEISGSGVFEDDAAIERVRVLFIVGTIEDWRLSIPSWQQIDCPMHIASLEIDGPHDNAVSFSISLQSSGKPVFTAI